MVDGSTLGEAKAFWQQEIELDTNQQYQFDYWVKLIVKLKHNFILMEKRQAQFIQHRQVQDGFKKVLIL